MRRKEEKTIRELLTKEQIEVLENSKYFEMVVDLFDCDEELIYGTEDYSYLCSKLVLDLTVIAHFYVSFYNIHFYVLAGYKSEMKNCFVYFCLQNIQGKFSRIFVTENDLKFLNNTNTFKKFYTMIKIEKTDSGKSVFEIIERDMAVIEE